MYTNHLHAPLHYFSSSEDIYMPIKIRLNRGTNPIFLVWNTVPPKCRTSQAERAAAPSS